MISVRLVKLFFLIVFVVIVTGCKQSTRLSGYYVLLMQGEKPFENGKMIKLYSGDRFMLAQYKEDGSVVMSGGGKFTLDEEGYTEVMDYFSEAPAQRGKPVTYRYTLTGNKFIIEAEMHGFTLKETWQKTDD